MKVKRSTRKWLMISGLWVLALVGIATSFAQERGGERGNFQRDGHGQVLDNRYNHGHYYPPRGQVVRSLPGGYRPYFYGGSHFYFSAGVWYAPGPYGFVVAAPPVGLVVGVLPPFYTTVWFGGVPLYYANDVYYQWRPDLNSYVIAAPPAGADQPGAAPAPAPMADNFFIYPRNGQTPEQQSADRYECHSWAVSQTGFDPTRAAQQSGNAADYKRAIVACLDARGYSAR